MDNAVPWYSACCMMSAIDAVANIKPDLKEYRLGLGADSLEFPVLNVQLGPVALLLM